MVPVGGTCPLGEWGYINAWEELRGQGALDDIDDVIVTFGSGGTTGGLAIGNYLTGSKVKYVLTTSVNVLVSDCGLTAGSIASASLILLIRSMALYDDSCVSLGWRGWSLVTLLM